MAEGEQGGNKTRPRCMEQVSAYLLLQTYAVFAVYFDLLIWVNVLVHSVVFL